MLRAQLAQVALADDPNTGYAALDVIQGLDYSLPAATTPILFPGPGITTNLLTYSGDESPNPLETCGWQNLTAAVGLPLIMLLPQAPASGLSATLAGPGGTESTTVGDLCLVDQNTYRSSDPVYGPTGLQILQGDNAAILIPRRPLETGIYSVSVQQTGEPDIDWSFSAQAPITVEQPAPPRPPVHTARVTKITKITVHGHSARIVITAPANTRLRCALAPQHGSHWRRVRLSTCRRITVYNRLRRGRYRLTVHSSAGNPSRVLSIT
jgi:hypothetical protein